MRLPLLSLSIFILCSAATHRVFAQQLPAARLHGGTPAALFNDLHSADSVTRESALSYIDSTDFGSLRVLLLGMTEKFEYGLNWALGLPQLLALHAVQMVGQDDLPVLDSVYRLPGCAEEARYPLLQIAAHVHTRAAIDTVLGMLAYKLPTKGESVFLGGELEDSLLLARTAYPALFHYSSDSLLGSALLMLERSLWKKRLLITRDFAPYKTNMAAYALGVAQQRGEAGVRHFSILTHILEQFPDTGTVSFFRQALSFPSNRDKLLAVSALLHLGRTVPASVLQTIAADKFCRIDLYDSLKTQHQTFRYPPAYLTRAAFATGYLYRFFWNEGKNEFPVTMTFIKQGLYFYKGKQRKFYVYSLRFKGPGKAYLGVAGPFDAADNSLWIADDENASGCDYLEELGEMDRVVLDKQVRAYLDRFSSEGSPAGRLIFETDTP